MAALSAAVVGCAESGSPGGDDARESRRVVLYVSADPHVYEPVVAAFEEQTGIVVAVRGDTEAAKTTGLVQRLRAERDHPQADVFWSSEVFLTSQLAQEGVLAPHDTPAVAEWPEALRDEGRLWHAFAMRARVIVFNSERMAASVVPGSLHDLLQPRFAGGRLAIARPQFGTTRGHMGALLEMWGDAVAARWIEDIGLHGARLYDGNASVVRAVAMGEVEVGLTDTDDVWAGQRNGWPVDLVYVRHDVPLAPGGPIEAGPLVIPNTVARIEGGPNPGAAAELIDFLLSERVERMLAESDSHNVPIREALAGEFPRYAVPDPAQVDYAKAAASMPRAMELCEQHLE
jgi:iron(III) transport system substrate-binding protein